MRLHELEVWARRVIEQVESGHPNEDSMVELKADIPDPKKAARRLAGHANAARGENILWLIGVDEKQGTVGLQSTELSDWYAVVKSEFNELAPETLLTLNIPVKDKTVVALLFATDRAPYVVKNPLHGTAGGGPVALDVPWRENNAVRSATRSDLLRLLSPLQRLPRVEVLEANLDVHKVTSDQPLVGSFFNWDLSASLYVYPNSENRLVMPYHRCAVSLRIDGIVEHTEFERLRFDLAPSNTFRETRPLSATVTVTPSEVLMDGPGKIVLRVSGRTPIKEGDFGKASAEVVLRMQPSEAEMPLSVPMSLVPVPPVGGNLGKWVLPPANGRLVSQAK